MSKPLPAMRIAMFLFGLMIFGLALSGMQWAERGLEVMRLENNGLPITVFAPLSSDLVMQPLVLVGHGFAGSQAMMRGYALKLAHAGYVVAVWDFDGHGQNLRRTEAERLLLNPRQVLDTLIARRLTYNQRVAIVGHSMGSGVALEYGQKYAVTEATVAISPVSRSVTPSLPHNLLLMAGSLEPRFQQNAEALLAQAGGAGGEPHLGSGRALVVVPGVEHISILYAPAAHQAVLDWIDATFGVQPGARPYSDMRLLWYGLGMLGMLLALLGVAPRGAPADDPMLEQDPLPARRLPKLTPGTHARWGVRPAAAVDYQPALGRIALGWLAGALAATLLLWLASRLGLSLRSIMGLSVGGYLLIWFGLAGTLAGFVSHMHWRRPKGWEIRHALVVLLALWLAVGWLGSWVWVNAWLGGVRLALWPLGVLLMLPWMLAAGQVVERVRTIWLVGLWLAHSLLLVLAFALIAQLHPELGFIILTLPLFPIILALHAAATAVTRSTWVFALSGAGFISWLLLAVFPLI